MNVSIKERVLYEKYEGRTWLMEIREGTKDSTICVTSCGPQEAMFFPVVMYRCESWIIKKAECQRINAFTKL